MCVWHELCKGKLVRRVPINGWKAGCLGSEELRITRQLGEFSRKAVVAEGPKKWPGWLT